MTTRRAFITGIVSLIAAPAIVRASSLMPVRAWLDEYVHREVAYGFSVTVEGLDAYGRRVSERLFLPELRNDELGGFVTAARLKQITGIHLNEPRDVSFFG